MREATYILVRAYREIVNAGTIERNLPDGSHGTIFVDFIIDGYWCEGRGFGEIQWEVGYRTDESYVYADSDLTPQESLERMSREIGALLSKDVRSGRHFIVCDMAGTFCRSVIKMQSERLAALKEAIAGYEKGTATIEDILGSGERREERGESDPIL